VLLVRTLALIFASFGDHTGCSWFRSRIFLNYAFDLAPLPPFLASLFFHRLIHSTGMQHECLQANSPWGLPTKEVLLPSYLKSYAGYSTHMVGKWDLGHFAPSLWPQSRGFDSFVGLICYGCDPVAHLYILCVTHIVSGHNTISLETSYGRASQ
jgi:hypothetical protein